MKQLNKIICLFLGHKVSEDEFWMNNNIDYCARCEEARSLAHDENFFTAREWYGLIRYPFLKLYLWFSNLRYRTQDKARKKELDDQDLPF